MDIHTLATLVERANREFVMPRFGNLKDSDIHDTSRDGAASKADTEAEAWLTEEILKRDPGAFVFGEEAYKKDPTPYQARDLAKGRIYFLDPLDGTYHFMRGEPHFGTLATIANNGRITGAVVHCPIMKVTVTAMAGQGVYINRQHVQFSGSDKLTKTDFVHVLQYEDMEGERGATLREHMGEFYRLCDSGKNAIFSVAARMATVVKNADQGRGFCEVSSGYYTPWDYAAPLLIMQELGGMIWQEKMEPLAFSCPQPQRLVLATSKVVGARALAHVREFAFKD